jgi:transposase InsO family protein
MIWRWLSYSVRAKRVQRGLQRIDHRAVVHLGAADLLHARQPILERGHHGQTAGGGAVPARPAAGAALPDPHRADRQCIQFTNRALDARAFAHIFDRVCSENGIEHRLIKVSHPWINGQVERMNRTIKEATVKLFYEDEYSQNRDILRISSTRINTPVDLSLSAG